MREVFENTWSLVLDTPVQRLADQKTPAVVFFKSLLEDLHKLSSVSVMH